MTIGSSFLRETIAFSTVPNEIDGTWFEEVNLEAASGIDNINAGINWPKKFRRLAVDRGFGSAMSSKIDDK